jgi:hypothetical protein
MKISGVNRSATVAWGASSEHASLLAAGTVAGAISDNFDSSAHLEVFKLDMSSQTGELSLLGSVSSSERFHRLAWGTKGMENGSMPYGMLAGGMVDGSIKIYSPAALIACAPPRPLTGPAHGLAVAPQRHRLRCPTRPAHAERLAPPLWLQPAHVSPGSSLGSSHDPPPARGDARIAPPLAPTPPW